MIDHVSIAVSDLVRSAAFYEAVLAPLGFSKLVAREKTVGFGKRYPEFWINLRAGRREESEGSGLHICLRARDTDAVAAFHEAALAHGGSSNGAPGPRPEYSDTYHAAFIRDPDGTCIEVVTFV